MSRYLVEFDFIEDGRKRHTAWDGGFFHSPEEAVESAREWFGFDKDQIEVTNTKVTKLGGND